MGGQLRHLPGGQGSGLLRGAVLGGENVFQTQTGDQGPDFQVQHQAHRRGLVALPRRVVVGVGVDGGVGADGAQGVADLSVGLVVQQVGPLAGLDGGVVDVFVHPRQAAELLNQGQGGFFADALDAGNIVRRVAHQALDVDELPGADPILGLHRLGVHDPGLAVAPGRGGQQDGGGIAHQLQVVPVSGGQVAGLPPLVTGGGQGAQNVVGLPALGRHQAVAQVGEKLAQKRHLGGQLLRHPVAGGLVAVVHLVAEGGGRQVKGDGHLVGLIGLGQGEQNVHKAIDGIGILPLFGGQHLDTEKSAVGDAVAVNDH